MMTLQLRRCLFLAAILVVALCLLASSTLAEEEATNDVSSPAVNDPKIAVLFAGNGGPFSDDLSSQDPRKDEGEGGGLRLSGVYFDTPKRYVFKRAHFSTEDRRIFDGDSGLVIQASHHWGKNPYGSLDPLDLLDVSDYTGGEWQSATDVSSYHDSFTRLRIRPKKLSRHGTQYVSDGHGVVMNVGRQSRLKTRSLATTFFVGRGKDRDAVVYEVVGDFIGRRLSVRNAQGQVVATITKTDVALLQVAAFGSGSESVVDVAPGVDASAILAIVFALGQVGAHYLKDAFANFVRDPVKARVVDGALGAVGDVAAGADLGDVAAEFADEVSFGIDAAGGLVDAAEGVGEVVEFAAEGLADVGEGLMDLLLSLL